MASLVLASAYFATTWWIGRNIKREVLAEHLARLGKRLGEMPEFAAYAIADGIKRAFTRFGRWLRTLAETVIGKHEEETVQLLPGFAEMFDLDCGCPRLKRETAKTTSKNAHQPLFAGVRRTYVIKKWVNFRRKNVHSVWFVVCERKRA